ncbi:uncharacterized protein F4822DRAFT_106046 [Hypoxylon trugodes]|uniref:uncharacterized protein n=1 Tax=Hypoxylon trugodes TaxID=326681 RepID=UPI002197C981|nr:uncharacterized protein F4822DRAFT_106046 [Hypoxylon trugodes]KAI1391828.1 hypothetical protein F4822DRAFT_106046 [Hypoxylon trugodes]
MFPTMAYDDAARTVLHRRLLSDIREMVEKPYPNIIFYPDEQNLLKACLVLTPANYKPLHLTVNFSNNYPLDPPGIHMDSSVTHPNVYGGWICATILRKTDEHTPAYTLKGIAIQLLSFFSSDSLEQEHGSTQKLDQYRAQDEALLDDFHCRRCKFPQATKPAPRLRLTRRRSYDARVDSDPVQWPTIGGDTASPPKQPEAEAQANEIEIPEMCYIDQLPNEVLLLILEHLEDFEQLTTFATSWPRISGVIRDFDVVRQRELQCFCLKQNYHTLKLGVGISFSRGHIASEFDLISQEAFSDLRIRKSVNNIPFNHWLPLPISHKHWGQVKNECAKSLDDLKPYLKNTEHFGKAEALFTFMNDVVVRLNQVLEPRGEQSHKSNLRHASEKAIDSYFHLFHLLVCYAVEDPSLVEQANSLLGNFINGKQSKTDCPNLGHLLIALLISDVEVTERLMQLIITEAITRNVVWLFDAKGANMPELSFMESEPISRYRLNKTFEGSRTSYRLLMFSELFRRTARPSHTKPLTQVRDELFERHGAPPHNAAQELSSTVRRLHKINDFPSFLREMGLHKVPDPQTFTRVLRNTVHLSMERGYSKWGWPREVALLQRYFKDKELKLSREDSIYAEQNKYKYPKNVRLYWNFFPGRPGDNNPGNGNRGGRGGGRGGRGGRGRGRGGRGRGQGF